MSIRHLSAVRPERTAFVLGGGGNLGAVQVGMLRALIERGIRPDLLVGCSVGALNAAAMAAGPTLEAVDRLTEVWRSLRDDDICPSSRLSSLRLLTRKAHGVTSGAGLRRLIEDCLPYRRFDEAAVPLHVVTTSLRTGRERWFSSGPVVDAVLASAALPGVFPPVNVEGEMLIDGAVVDNVPIVRAAELGATRAYVLHVGHFDRPRPAPRRPLDVLLQSLSIARSYRFLQEVERPPAGIELIVLPAVDPGALRYNDFGRSRQLLERGHAAAAAFLDLRRVAAAGS